MSVEFEWLEPEFTTVGDEIMAAIEVVLSEAFSDLPDDDAPPWPHWLFGTGDHAEKRGEYVHQDMVPVVYRACLEGGVGMAGDIASFVGFGALWAQIMDIALTYAVRIGLHSIMGYAHGDKLDEIFFDDSYVRGTLITTVNEAVIPFDEEEDE